MPSPNAEEQLLSLLKLPKGEEPDLNGPQYSMFRSKEQRVDDGHFCWIWMFGQRIPSIVVNYEPLVPFEEIVAVLSANPAYDSDAFQDVLKTRSIFMPLATRKQVEMLRTNAPHCRHYCTINLRLIGRSDIERVLGEFRKESVKTSALENDYWDDDERFIVSHYNFADYNEHLFMNDDPDADISQSGTLGWYYPSRSGFRCIVCCSCRARFTPNDFSVHFHSIRGDESVRHRGLNSNNWAKTVRPCEADKEHMEIWQHFIATGTARVVARKRSAFQRHTTPMVKRLAVERRSGGEVASTSEGKSENVATPVAVKFDENLQKLSLCLLTCSQKTRNELQQLSEKLQQTLSTKSTDAWAAVLKEQSLFKELSDEAVQVLDGRFNPFAAIKLQNPASGFNFSESAFKIPKRSEKTMMNIGAPIANQFVRPS